MGIHIEENNGPSFKEREQIWLEALKRTINSNGLLDYIILGQAEKYIPLIRNAISTAC